MNWARHRQSSGGGFLLRPNAGMITPESISFLDAVIKIYGMNPAREMPFKAPLRGWVERSID
ncbi:MAG: hypothetical protein RQ741_01070 [Wenzhouxiangellaceae bacterium]|nr:hypothetical protein [Wenzhouxiangellaceae bacterium]